MNLILIGFMGVGKTRVGRRLAARLGWPFFDTDRLVEERRGLPIPEIFSRYGEASFRETEKVVVEEVARNRQSVIATGGGVVVDQENVDRLRHSGFLVHLTLPCETIYRRIGKTSQRPLLHSQDPRQSLEDLFRSREGLYHGCSDLTIDREGLTIQATVERLLERLVFHGTDGNLQMELNWRK